MLAARDKENLVHAHQTTASAKPLNQGVRQLQPKTPFKVPLHDENDVLVFGKKTVKGNAAGGGNTQQRSKDAFITPLEPRHRAPLGMKTTNAKATGFKTPGQQADILKTQKTNRKGSSLKKAKKVEPVIEPSHPQLFSKPDQDEVRDVEYAPPKPQELPDDPEEITYDTTFPQFKGPNMIRGWERIYLHGDVGEDGLTDRERKFQQQSIAYDKMVNEMIQKQVENIDLANSSIDDGLDLPQLAGFFQGQPEDEAVNVSSKKLPSKGVSTVKARNAAAALSRSGAPSDGRADVARTSTAVRSRTPASLLVPKRKTPTPTNPSTKRHTTGASSRTTLGYSKGRSVSSSLQNKTHAIEEKQAPLKGILDPERYMQLYGAPPAGSDMWMRCKQAGLLAEPEDAAYDDKSVQSLLAEDEDARNFQLTL